jgi:hypothetical protein
MLSHQLLRPANTLHARGNVQLAIFYMQQQLISRFDLQRLAHRRRNHNPAILVQFDSIIQNDICHGYDTSS